MALGDSYATLAELKTRIEVDDAVDDAALTNALASASRGVDAFCGDGRQFNTDNTATAKIFYPLSADLALVDDFHTTTGLVVKSDDNEDGTFETTWASTDYQLEPLNKTRHGETWAYWKIRAVGSRSFRCARRATLEVTAQWGWAAVPAPVKEACLVVAEETFKLKDAPFGVAGYGEFGAVRVRNNPLAAKMLMPYRRKALVA